MTNPTWKIIIPDSEWISAPRIKRWAGSNIECLGGGGSALIRVVREDLSEEMTFELTPE